MRGGATAGHHPACGAASPAGAQGQGRTSKPPMISSALRLCARIWAAICSRCFPGSVLNIRAEVRHVPPTPRPRPARPPSRMALSLPQRADGSGHVSKGLCERKREAASQLPQDAPASLETEAMSGAARTRAKWHGKGRPQARARPSTSRDVTPTRAGRPPTSAPRRTQPTRAIAPTAAAPTARCPRGACRRRRLRHGRADKKPRGKRGQGQVVKHTSGRDVKDRSLPESAVSSAASSGGVSPPRASWALISERCLGRRRGLQGLGGAPAGVLASGRGTPTRNPTGARGLDSALLGRTGHAPRKPPATGDKQSAERSGFLGPAHACAGADTDWTHV